MPLSITHNGKTWRLVPKVGNGFTTFEWVEVAPKPAQEQSMEASE